MAKRHRKRYVSNARKRTTTIKVKSGVTLEVSIESEIKPASFISLFLDMYASPDQIKTPKVRSGVRGAVQDRARMKLYFSKAEAREIA